MEIRNRAVLITGGSRGLGRALAKALALGGARVVLVARGSEELDQAVEEIRSAGGEVYGIVADIGDKDSIYPIAGEAAALVGTIEILIQNASTLGPVPLRLLLDTDCEDLERALEVNLVGPFRLAKVVVGSMALRGQGIVVHITSDAAVEAYPGWGAYGVTKAALDHMTRIFAKELCDTGVRFLSIDPGDMNTQMHADAVPDADPATLPQPEDVASRILEIIRRADHFQRLATGDNPNGGDEMTSATAPRTQRETARMLVLYAGQGSLKDATITDLPDVLQPGDLIIMNDAATIPASLFAQSSSDTPVEIRLLQHLRDADWKAVLFGAGDWRTPTELRDLPQKLAPGSILRIGRDFAAEVIVVADDSGRLVTLRLSRQGTDMWTAIYAYGHPIQYSYLKSDLKLWSVQTVYASRPWAAEMPSAGQPLTWRILLELKRRGIAIASLTHAAGISAIGDQDLDARLPFPERYEIPQSTIDLIRDARLEGGRILAVGTTVVRALEGCSVQNGGQLVPGVGETDLVIRPGFRRSVVDGILTGIHDPAQSHFQLLSAFADENVLRRAWNHAMDYGYLGHEFGDSCLIVP